MPRILLALAAAASLAAAPLAAAQKPPPDPKPETYLCPDALGGKAVDCFLNAVEHLYTMCRQVKSIEIIEFGYEKSEEGVNAAKSEYCVDKHKLSMTRPYQAALREATGSRTAVDGLRALHDLWLKALAGLKWMPGESDEQYKARISEPYTVFSERAAALRVEIEQLAATKASSTRKTAAPKAKRTSASGKSSSH